MLTFWRNVDRLMMLKPAKLHGITILSMKIKILSELTYFINNRECETYVQGMPTTTVDRLYESHSGLLLWHHGCNVHVLFLVFVTNTSRLMTLVPNDNIALYTEENKTIIIIIIIIIDRLLISQAP